MKNACLHVALAALAAGAFACAKPPAGEDVSAAPAVEPSPSNGGVCAELARVFFVIAQKRHSGLSRDASVKLVEESVDHRFAVRPEQTRRSLVRVVDLVYGVGPEVSAREVEASVLERCVVNEQGQAMLLTRRPPGAPGPPAPAAPAGAAAD